MQIRFYANMRAVVGRESVEITDLGGDHTFGNLLNILTQQFPELCSQLFDVDGNLRQDVPIFINGRNPRLSAQGLDTPLDSDAEISFFSPISSGRLNVEVLRDAVADGEDQTNES